MGIRQPLRTLAQRAGFDLVRHDPRRQRTTPRGALHNLTRLGVNPATVFDVGAAHGTPLLYQAFPSAHHVLIEPLEEYRSSLLRLTERLDAEYIIAAAGPSHGTVHVNVHPDLVGSSVMIELEDSDVNGTPRDVQQVMLDDFSTRPGPYFVKIDTQGYELEVLRGARKVLAAAEAVLLEVSLFRFFEGGPDLTDVVTTMHDWGFVTYDVLGRQYRPLDDALAQVDLLFVPEASPLRQHHVFATPEQRAAKTAELFERHRPDARGG